MFQILILHDFRVTPLSSTLGNYYQMKLAKESFVCVSQLQRKLYGIIFQCRGRIQTFWGILVHESTVCLSRTEGRPTLLRDRPKYLEYQYIYIGFKCTSQPRRRSSNKPLF